MTQELSSDPHANIFQARNVIIIKERSTHIPTFYQQHENPGRVYVKQDGHEFLPRFTVADMPPERRWAVRDDGNILDQQTFERLYMLKYEEWFRFCEDNEHNAPGDPRNIYIPSVSVYVKFKVDPRDSRKLIEMNYDPDAKSDKSPEKLYDSKGENPISGEARLSALVDQYRKDSRKLFPKEIEEVEEYLCESRNSHHGDLLSRIDELKSLRDDGVISDKQFAERVVAISGGPEPRSEKVVVVKEDGSAKPKSMMKCGTEVFNFHKKRHIAKCDVCREEVA